jgi:hypothetical protein
MTQKAPRFSSSSRLYGLGYRMSEIVCPAVRVPASSRIIQAAQYMRTPIRDMRSVYGGTYGPTRCLRHRVSGLLTCGVVFASPNRFDGVEGCCPSHRQGRRGWDHRDLCRRRHRFSFSTIGPTCRSAGLSFDDWASNTRLRQSRNHGGTRLIGSRRLLRSKSGDVVSLEAESFLKGISAIVRAICRAERGSTSDSSLTFPIAAEATLPRSQRLGLGRGGFTLAVLAVLKCF